jgi:hypothetical protein
VKPAAVAKVRSQKEGELVDLFLEHVRACGFKAFPETADFDVLLVATEVCTGFKAGDQIGVEAKIRANIDVMYQALPRRGSGPHYYVILVPDATHQYREIATALGITVVTKEMINVSRPGRSIFNRIRARRHEPTALCWVPDCEIPGMRGGIAGPKKITKWKMNAVKLCMLGVSRGYLRAQDFHEAGIRMDLFVKNEWVKQHGKEAGPNGRPVNTYVLVDENNPPHLKYMDVTEALEKAGLI